MISIFLIVVVAFLVIFLSFFFFFLISLFSLSSFTLKTYEHDKNPRKKLIAKLLEKPGDLLITIMMMCIISDILVQNILASFWKNSASFLLNVGVPLLLTLLLGEVIPKSFAYPKAKKTAYLVAPLIAILFKFLGPLRKFLSVVTNYVSAAMFSFL
ncbi:MAG: DUF21 domain-containing protein [Chlamydiae bacterium]|nr:DUF21 domain-containing protein [Chlamydiota bacterium]